MLQFSLIHHIIQRGNNREICFVAEVDYAAYAHWLKKDTDEFGVAVHTIISGQARYGTLWEGRFKSCLLGLNPVRAKMVNTPSEYSWSSYGVNGLGQVLSLCVPHESREALQKGTALGGESFKALIKASYGRRVTQGVRGRPMNVKKFI